MATVVNLFRSTCLKLTAITACNAKSSPEKYGSKSTKNLWKLTFLQVKVFVLKMTLLPQKVMKNLLKYSNVLLSLHYLTSLVKTSEI